MGKILLLILTIIFNGCSGKTEYIKPKCPYIVPIDLTIHTNDNAGLDAENTAKALHALKYYSSEARRLEKFINGY